MPISRLAQKEELWEKLGKLIGPIEEIAKQGDAATDDEITRALGLFWNSYTDLVGEVHTFSISDPGYKYQGPANRFNRALNEFSNAAADNPRNLAHHLKKIDEARAALRSIPADLGSAITPAGSPFTFYCTLKIVCKLATSELILLDRYVHDSVFFRYFSDINSDVLVTLITTTKRLTRPFLDISGLFAGERGPDGYRLISVSDGDVHDRLLRADNNLYVLGGSTHHAATTKDFTIAQLEATDGNFNQLNKYIETGTQQFGPENPKHPNTPDELV